MKKNDVVRYKGKYLRILNIIDDKVLVIDCVKKYMPYWTDLFNESEVVDISTIYKLNNKSQESIEEISPLRRSEAYKRYALISGVASLISNKELYIELIARISEENKISDQTIRKYLIEYLIYQDISVLAPKIKMEKLWNDAFEFFDKHHIGCVNHKWQVSKTIRGKRLNTIEIAAVAMFLGISTKELALMDYSDVLPHEQFDRELFKLHYNQKLNFAEISRRTGWDYSYIKTVTYKNKKRGTNKKLINRGGIEPRDYKALDNEYFPIVKEAINKLKNSKDEKPQKVSLMKVEKIVCLSEGTLYKMPKCYKYIQANIEPIEAYWIRCLNWNYNQLILKNDSLTKSKLIKPLNINNGDISRICSYLDKNKKINTSKEIVDIIASGKYS